MMSNINASQSGLNFHGIKCPVYETKLNLVALMDIFTILVFFLLLNSGDADQIDKARFIKLPSSSASAAAHLESSIIIGEKEIWFNDETIAFVEDIVDSSEKTIQPLSIALKEHIEKRGELSEYEKLNGLAVTIVGDQSVSYQLLERVMFTCSKEQFRDISLAVNRIAAPIINLSESDTAGRGE